MKNQKQFLIGVIALAILIPQITFAAWWNPFSWKIFNRPQQSVPVVEVPIEKVEPTIEVQSEPVSDKKSTVPKTIPVNNTNNQPVEIEKLKKEIEVLKQKIGQYNQATVTVPNIVPVVVKPTPTVLPPTAQQLGTLLKMCGEVPEACKDPKLLSGYMSNISFRVLVDAQVEKYNQAKSAQQQEAISAQKKQLGCLSEPTPPELRTLSPEEQKRIREVKCGATTPTSNLEYKLYQEQRYQECVNKNPTSYTWYCQKPIFY